MNSKVSLLVFDVVGQRTIASSPRTMEAIEHYAYRACTYGLSQEEIAFDIASKWPSARRDVEVTISQSGDVWVTLVPSRAVFVEAPSRSDRLDNLKRPSSEHQGFLRLV